MADKEYLDFITMADNTKLYVPQVKRISEATSASVTLSSGNDPVVIISKDVAPPTQANGVLVIGQVQFASNANGRRAIDIYRTLDLSHYGRAIANTQVGPSPSGVTIINTMAYSTVDANSALTTFSLRAAYTSSTASTLNVTKASMWLMFFQ